MKQSIHIFLKDVRFLRIEICVLLACWAILAWLGSHPRLLFAGVELPIEAAALYLIARLIQAEPIPGDNQFWLTRPYSRTSLAGAKIAFIAAFVCAPVCAAQVVMLVSGRFPLAPAIPGLLWSQMLIFAESLAVAALAATTSGTALTLSVIILSALPMLAVLIFPALGYYSKPVPYGLEWVSRLLATAIVTGTAGFVLFRQYRDRATGSSRITGLAGVVLAAAVYVAMPAGFAFAVQSSLSGKLAGNNQVRISIDPAASGFKAGYGGGRHAIYRRIRIPVPVSVRGVPAGTDALVDSLAVTFEWAGGDKWKPNPAPGLNQRAGKPGLAVADATVLMDPAMYEAKRDAPLTLRGAAYITLFGDEETRTATVGPRPVNFQDGLQCYSGDFDYVYCRSFFRWPGRLVTGESGPALYTFLNSLISYSPLPANGGLIPLEVRSGGELRTRELRITTKRPVAHFWREFQVSGLRLRDF